MFSMTSDEIEPNREAVICRLFLPGQAPPPQPQMRLSAKPMSQFQANQKAPTPTVVSCVPKNRRQMYV